MPALNNQLIPVGVLDALLWRSSRRDLQPALISSCEQTDDSAVTTPDKSCAVPNIWSPLIAFAPALLGVILQPLVLILLQLLLLAYLIEERFSLPVPTATSCCSRPRFSYIQFASTPSFCHQMQFIMQVTNWVKTIDCAVCRFEGS
jgi:hypothetical protein